MLAQSTSTSTEGARRTKRSKFTTTKATKPIPATRNIAGGTQVRLKMVDPSSRDRRDREQERDSQRAAATGYRKNAREQHQGKQARDNEISAFDFFDKRHEEEEQRESDQELPHREATQSHYSR